MAVSTRNQKPKPKPKPKPNAPAFKPDTYDQGVMDEEYGFVGSLINSDPEIRAIHEEAANNGWFDSAAGRARYKLKIQDSQWYQNNNKYARAAITAFNLNKQGQGADWKAMVQNARLEVERTAAQEGSVLSDAEKDVLATRYIYEGWNEAGRKPLMVNALADSIKMKASAGGGDPTLYGAAGDLAQKLRRYADDNGITYSESFYQSAAQSVAKNLTTEQDWMRDIEAKSTSMWPVFANQIKAGMTAKDLASPYRALMAQTFEISEDSISLNDPYIRSALGGFGQDGNPTPVNLWDFQKQLRNDPRWANTKQALDETSSVASGVLRMFGFGS